MASQTSALPQDTADLRRHIDAALSEISDFPSDCPPKLREAIRYALLAPGKRLRPLLALWAAAACCRVLAEAAGPCHLVGGRAWRIEGRPRGDTVGTLESNHRRKTWTGRL